MKVRVIIVGGVIFVLGLATVVLSIYVAQLGAGSTGWQLPQAIDYPIEVLEALERTHNLYVWLLYFGLGFMVIGLAVMIAGLTLSSLGVKRLQRPSGRRDPSPPTHSRSASHS